LLVKKRHHAMQTLASKATCKGPTFFT
jgi:hypothetical protein